MLYFLIPLDESLMEFLHSMGKQRISILIRYQLEFNIFISSYLWYNCKKTAIVILCVLKIKTMKLQNLYFV